MDEIVLSKLGLFGEDQGKMFPANAMVLLSDDKLRLQLFPYAKIECARFKGKDIKIAVFDDKIERPARVTARVTADYGRLRPITADYGRLSIEEKKILLHLLDNENITRREAIILLNLGKTKVKELFIALLEKELLERKGQGRSTYYVVSKKEDKG